MQSNSFEILAKKSLTSVLTKQVSNHNIWYGRWSVYWATAVSSIFELDEKWPANGFRNQAVGSQQGLLVESDQNPML